MYGLCYSDQPPSKRKKIHPGVAKAMLETFNAIYSVSLQSRLSPGEKDFINILKASIEPEVEKVE